MEALTATINEAEKRVSDIQDKMMESNKAKKKRERYYWIMRGDFKKSAIPQSTITFE